MDKILKSTLFISLMGLSLNGSSLESLNKRIDSLEKQLIILKSSQADSDDELEERIDEVETSIIIDKIKFGLEFRTRVDNYNVKKINGDDKNYDNLWSNRVRLKMKSKISYNLKFTGRLTMYKNWSDSDIDSYSNIDYIQARRPNDSSIFLERAYVDWVLTDGKVPVILTLGRQPSSDGPSHQFKDNTVRKSTYSALSFDGVSDGLMTTFNLEKVSDVEGMAVRVGYAKGYQSSLSQNYTESNNGLGDSNVYGIFFDTSLIENGSLLQLSAVYADNIISNVPDDNKNIGDMLIYTAMVEFTNIYDSGLDIFTHYAINQMKPNGQTSSYNGINMDLLESSASGETTVSTNNVNGSAYWLGMRYTIPNLSFNNPRIGIEYNHGDKNWFSFTQGSNDVTNKLATRGDATEIYYIQPINRYAYLRFGVEMIDYDYTGSGFQLGSPTPISESIDPNEVDKLNNYYFLFNLSY